MDIGTTLILKKPRKNDDVTYHCKIIDYDHRYVFIDYPVHQLTQRTAFFNTGTCLIASYIGEDDASYSFPTEVMAKVTMTVPALAIKPPQGNIRRTQRRQFVRVNTAVDVAIHCPTQSFRPFVTVTVDLSGGGLSIILPKEKTLNEGQSVLMWAVLRMASGTYEYISLKAKVIRIHMTDGALKTASLKYTDITPKAEQVIIKYCFEKQREERQKGIM